MFAFLPSAPHKTLLAAFQAGRKRRRRSTASQVELLEDRALLSVVAPFPEFVDPNPNAGNQFGHTVLPLSTGNVVITSPYDDAGGTDAGAVYLFDGSTGELISTLTGSSDHDRIGFDGVEEVGNGNFVVISQSWDNGSIQGAGAVTWGDGTTGITGVVSAANSLVGSQASDRVGRDGVTVLPNGNYVVVSERWDNGGVQDAGAVTWGDGNTGIAGVVSAANSLVGSQANDQIGYGGVTPLTNGNYVVSSHLWDDGGVQNAGGVTWGDGTTGITGEVSASNSLVGSQANDQVGNLGVTALTNGNYVVRSSSWDNGGISNVGAVTWGDGTTGVTGTVSSANSLVGSQTDDQIGVVTALANGNYVVISSLWDNGANQNAGAVTWADGTTGITGTISVSNSLVGSQTNDQIGNSGATALTNGNYVVSSSNWDNGGIQNAGAVTWGDGTTGITGTVSSSNSLVGSQAFSSVGSGGVTALTNGNYVARSPLWDNGGIQNVGAVTWGDGTTGVTGTVSSANSLVGSQTDDNIGGYSQGGVTALTNGNYVVSSNSWDRGGSADAGAVTWANGTTGITGVVSPTNSLVGGSGDRIGNYPATALTNGNYVVRSPSWDNGGIANVGAVTWGNGTTGITGSIGPWNSLVGSQTEDAVGSGVTALTNGNYVVQSERWNNGVVQDAGAVTWGDGATGISGVVNASNSLIGTTANDSIGSSGAKALANGNYLVQSSYWDNGGIANVGAVTFGDGDKGTAGPITALNSSLGTTFNDPFAPISLSVDDQNHSYYASFYGELEGRVYVRSQWTHFFGSSSTPTFPGSDDSDQFEIYRDGADVVVERDNMILFRESATSVSTITILGGDGDDSLSINLDGDLPMDIIFDGQGESTSTGDTLSITGGASITDAVFNYDNANDGSIDLTSQGLITYTGLEPIFADINATNITLNYSDSAETIIVSDASGGMTTASSTAGETTTFANPSSTLVINAGDVGKNAININGLESGFSADLTITGGSGGDSVVINGPLVFSADKSLQIDSHTISTFAGIHTTGSGSITLTATQSVMVGPGSNLRTVDGAIALSGNAGGTSILSSIGVEVSDATIQSTGAGTISLTGIGGNGPLDNSDGVFIGHDSLIQVQDSTLTITGTAVTGDASGVRLHETSGGQLVSTGSGAILVTAIGSGTSADFAAGADSVIGGPSATGNITLNVDSIDLSGTTSVQSTGALLIEPRTASTSIGLGGGVGTLNLDDTELSFLQDGFSSITIGDVNSGTGAVDTDTATFLDPVTIAGGVIHDHAGADITAPEVTLVGDVAPGQSPGVLNVNGNFAFANDSTFNVELAAGTSDQIAVTGTVNIGTGVALNLSFWDGVVRTGEDFVIVDNDGADAVTGTFASLPQGAIFNDLLGSGKVYRITYTGGDGNDIVLENISETPSSIVGRLGGNWWVAESNGTNAFTTVHYGNWGNEAWQNTQTGDFNADGLTDIASQLNGTWYVGLSNGSSFTKEVWGHWNTGVTWSDIMTADVDGDGDTDIVGRVAGGGWWVARSNGANGFVNEPWGYWSPSAGWQDVMVADVDGDGNDDIVGRESNGNWWVARSNGTTGFTHEYWGYWSESAGWNDVLVADVDGDGDSDIVGRADSGTWWVARSNGVNGFTNESWGFWVPTAGWRNVMVADIDGDGDDDIVGRAGNGIWWTARSDGTSSLSTEYWGYWVNTAGWTDILVADVDQDGNDDIVGRQSNGNIWVGHSNGIDGFTNERWGFWSPGDWQDVAAISSGSTLPAPASTYVPSITSDDDDETFFA